MPSQLTTLHLDFTSSDPIERAKLRVTLRHTDERGISYDEPLMLDANDFPALRDIETAVLAVLTQKVGKPVEVLAVAEAIVTESAFDPEGGL